MSRVLISLCVLLAACQQADGAVAPTPEAPAANWVQEPHERVIADVQFASTFAEKPLRAAEAAPASAAEAAARLAVTCPYARASWQLALALQLEVERVDPATLDPATRNDWRALRSGLAKHAAALEAMGIGLALPEFGDHLFGYLPDEALQTRADLEASAHPVHDTLPLIYAIDEIVQGYPPHIKERLNDDYPIVAEGFTEEGTLSLFMGAWLAALDRMSTHSHEPEAHEWLAETIVVLKEWKGHGC